MNSGSGGAVRRDWPHPASAQLTLNVAAAKPVVRTLTVYMMARLLGDCTKKCAVGDPLRLHPGQVLDESEHRSEQIPEGLDTIENLMSLETQLDRTLNRSLNLVPCQWGGDGRIVPSAE